MSSTRTAKEMARDLIAKAGLSRLHVLLRKLRGQNVNHLRHARLSERFSAVYEDRVWLNGRASGSLSGLGSELENTEPIRRQLPTLLDYLKARSLLDVGCGDFGWMKEVALPCSHTYMGIDIVPSLIRRNTALYGSAQRSFHVMDATCDPLPRADTVLCREVLFHLSFIDIWRVIENVQKSGTSYLIATNDSDLHYNADILSGDFRLLNLHKAPFFFPSPALSIPDNCILPNRTLSAWSIADLPRRGQKLRHRGGVL